MRDKGCRDASTIHSLIYRLRKARKRTVPNFVLNDDSAAGKAALIVIDECSMVDEEIGRDLLSFGVPVLVLGDPAQLPPVAGGGFFTDAEPDVMLTEVHRQAADDPIIRLSMVVREGGALDAGIYGESRVDRPRRDRAGGGAPRRPGAGRPQQHAAKLQCPHPRTARARSSAMPVAGDKLVCLRNDRKRGLLNGSVWHVDRARKPRKGALALHPLARGRRGRQAPHGRVDQPGLLRRHRRGAVLSRAPALRRVRFRLRPHRPQGAGLAVGRRLCSSTRASPSASISRRWLYTGITRAATRITMVSEAAIAPTALALQEIFGRAPPAARSPWCLRARGRRGRWRPG